MADADREAGASIPASSPAAKDATMTGGESAPVPLADGAVVAAPRPAGINKPTKPKRIKTKKRKPDAGDGDVETAINLKRKKAKKIKKADKVRAFVVVVDAVILVGNSRSFCCLFSLAILNLSISFSVLSYYRTKMDHQVNWQRMLMEKPARNLAKRFPSLLLQVLWVHLSKRDFRQLKLPSTSKCGGCWKKISIPPMVPLWTRIPTKKIPPIVEKRSAWNERPSWLPCANICFWNA